MLVEHIKSIFNRQSFAVLICISAIIHIGLIASSSRIKDMIAPYVGQSINIDDPVETTIEFVLNEDTYTGNYQVENKALDIIEDIANEDEELEEKKRQLFVDSSQLKSDEESQVETDKIGEKGSIARNKETNNNPLDGESFSQGESEILSLAKGAYSYAQDTNKGYITESLPEEKIASETENQQDLKLLGLDIEKEFKPQKANEYTKKEDYRKEDTTLKNDGEKDNLEVSHRMGSEETASLTEYQHEELRTIDSEFERIIPLYVDPKPLKSSQENESDKSEAAQDNDDNERKDNRDLADLHKKEKEKIVKEISEWYEQDINEDQRQREIKLKPKVSMGVNGKSVYNVPAPSFKADLSNTTLLGEPSFNIKKHEYAAYYKHIRDKISLYWLLYFGTDQSIKLETKEGRPIIIEFKIRPSGKITDVVIAEDGGNPFLASRTQVSVNNTQLDAFPSFIKEEFVDIRFNFYFF